MKRLFTLLILLFLMSASSWAAVSTYTFASSSGTYTPISGGTVIAPSGVYFDDNVYNANPIGFNFLFNGAVHTLFSVNANGWICMGATATSSYEPINSGNNNVISAIGKDLSSSASGLSTIESKLIGTAPNRVLVVQFLHVGKYAGAPGGLEDYNCQIRLYETTNVVEIVYGTFTVTGTGAFQVGLRGNSTADFNSRTTTTSWAATTAGIVSSTCTLSSTVLPASGLKYTFTPPVATAPAAPITITFSAVAAGAMTVNWVDNSTDETNFTLIRALDAGFTTGLSSTVIASTTTAATGGAYNSVVTGLNPSTTYFYSIIASNDGAASAELKGNQATTAPATISSTTLGGLWSSTATWIGGVVPFSYDNVTIATGSTVVVNQNVTCLNLNVVGTLQWITSTTPSSIVNVMQAENITVSATGYLYAHATVAAGAYIKVLKSFINNGFVNFAAPSSFLVFNGTSSAQTLGGTGTFLADMSGRGMIANLFFNSLAACDITTTQNLVTGNLAHTAGSLNTNGKLSIDNTAVCFGNLINRSISTVTVNNMGTGYTSAPAVAFTAAPAGGITATGVANFDVATGTIRSITITNAGDGYRVAPTFTFTGGGGAGLAAVAALYQSFSFGTNSLGQKSAIATISGGLTIKSDQAVGSVWVTNGGLGYTSAPTVGFSLPTGYLNLVTAVGSGYSAAPTVTISGGGGSGAAATAIVTRGQVTSVNITFGGTGYTSTPTFTLTGTATAALPAGALPTATAIVDATLGMVTGFSITNGGFGYVSAPTVTLTGTAGTAATGATARLGLYNLTLNWFAPAASNGTHSESDFIPVNRRINTLSLSSATGFGLNLTGDLECYSSTSMTLTGNLNMGGYTLTFSNPSNTGTAGSATAFVSNGKITYKLLGSTSAQTRTFPFNSYDGISGFFNNQVSMGNAPVFATDGSTITSITGSIGAAPTGTNMIGTRTLRLQTNSGALYGTNPTVRLTWNSVDALVADAAYLTIAQAAATSGPWTIRSVASGTGAINPAGGNRTTATTTVGPIVPTGDDYFGWKYDAPACPSPTVGTTTSITTTSAILDWSNGGTETLWNVKWSAGTFDPLTAGTLISNIAAHPYTLNPPLVSATTYTWYVQANCGSSVSNWSGPYSFTTVCGAIASLPWTEGFEGVTIPAFPSCWFKENGDWVTTNNAATTYDADARTGTQFLRETYTATNEYMWSPGFALTSGTSYDFSFWWAGDNYAGWDGDVFYNTSPISTGVTIMGSPFVSAATTTTKTYAQVIKTLVAPSTGTYYFAIRINGTGVPWYLSFDDFKLDLTPACPYPSALTAAPAGFQATLGWTQSGTVSSWDIEWGASGFTQGTGTTVTGVSNPYVLLGLTPSTPYAYYVRANCGSGSYSTWSGPKTFTTTVACPAPTTLTVTDILTDKVTLGWTETGAATLYDVEVQPAAIPFTNTPTATGQSNPYTYGGLTLGTAYHFQVRANCGGSSGVSAWSGNLTFNTACDVLVAPYIEHFATQVIPPCWSISGPQNWLFTTSWPAYGAAGLTDHSGTGGSFAGVDGSGSVSLTAITMLSPQINIAALTTERLRFYLFNNNISSTLLADEQKLQVNMWNGASWVGIYTWDYGQNAAGWQEIIVNLVPVTNTGTVQFQFVVDKGATNPFYDDIIIDDIYVENVPSCSEPTALNITGITNTGAVLNWTAASPAPANGYNWEIRTSGLPGSGSPVASGSVGAGITTTGLVNTLLPATAYSAYVQSNCGTGTSTWVGPVSFTTALCAPANQCNYTVEMTDAYGDGWNGAVLGFKQGGIVVGTFGTGFTTGFTYGPASIPLCDALSTQIVVVATGTYPEEVGFVVKDPFGNVVYTYAEGTAFTLSTIFLTFTTQCTIPAHDVATLSIDMSDTYTPGPVAPMATVKNVGANTETFNVTMTIGAYTSTKTVTALASFASQQVTFDSWNATAGSYTVNVCTALAGDVNATNDCLGKTVSVYAVGGGGWLTGAAITTGSYMGSGVGFTDNSVAPPVGYLFTMGGNTILMNEVQKYNLTTDAWTTLAPLPAGRTVLASANVGNFIYAIGGSDGAATPVYTNTVYKFDITAGTWSTVAPLPIAMAWCKAVGYGNTIYVAGGVDGSSVLLSSVYVYDVTADTWSAATSMPGEKFGGAFAVTGNKLVYAGGANIAGISNSVYVGTITAPTTISWITAKSAYPGTTGEITVSDIDPKSISATSVNSGNATKGFYPGGAMYRYDAAPWGTDGVIMTTGSPSSAWTPATPNPCYVYKPATDTWIMQPVLPIPVLGAYLGSVDLDNAGTHSWNLIVASGYTGTVVTTATQILKEIMAPATKTLNAKLYLEGLYNAGTGMMNKAQGTSGDQFPGTVADQVTVELHNATAPYAVAYTYSGVDLNTNGTLSIPTLPGAITGSYYIVIKHRNSIETWSKLAFNFSGAGPFTYDFSTAVTQAYGDNMKLKGAVYVIYGGDFSQDGLVDGSDMAAIDNASTISLAGYNPQDVNGDGLVDGSDMALVDNNSTASIQTAKP